MASENDYQMKDSNLYSNHIRCYYKSCEEMHSTHVLSSEAGVTAGVAARAAEMRKHEENDAKCT